MQHERPKSPQPRAKGIGNLHNPPFVATFVGNMRNTDKRIRLIFSVKALKLRSVFTLLILLIGFSAHAEVVVLRTGAEIRGTVVFQNEDVVIIKDATGARYQYPRADVLSVSAEKSGEQNGENDAFPEGVPKVNATKRLSVLLEIAGGGATIPSDLQGGAFEAGLAFGSHHIGDKRIFLGGGVAYRGIYTKGTPSDGSNAKVTHYAFLPIQLVARFPIVEYRHTPLVGFSAGYGVGLSKDYSGGLCAGVNVGYCYRINEKTAVSVAADVQWQQARIATTTSPVDADGHVIVDAGGQPYTYSTTAGRNFILYGIRLGIFF